MKEIRLICISWFYTCLAVVAGNPPECGENQRPMLVTEEEICQPRCLYPELNSEEQKDLCFGPSASGICICNEGYLLTHENKCVLPENCPVQITATETPLSTGELVANEDLFPTFHHIPTFPVEVFYDDVLPEEPSAEGIPENADGILGINDAEIPSINAEVNADPETPVINEEIFENYDMNDIPEINETIPDEIPGINAFNEIPLDNTDYPDIDEVLDIPQENSNVLNLDAVAMPIPEVPKIICDVNEYECEDDLICHDYCPSASGTVDIVNCIIRSNATVLSKLEVCKCVEGFVRNADGVCIPREHCIINRDCPSQPCGENQVPCDGTYKCPMTCAMFLNNVHPHQCSQECGEDFCMCKKGYYLNAEGRCVPPSECEGYRECCEDEGEVWTNCGTDCEETCAVHGGFEPAPTPTYECIPNSCVCRRDHVRDANGKCVPRKDCPVKAVCCENEQWTNCGTSCPQTCASVLGLEPLVSLCTSDCVPNTCECIPGFVLTPNSTCVLPEFCPQVVECCENEVWTNCGPEFEKTCIDVHDPFHFVKSDKCIRNTCVCRVGFVRDVNGVCVPEYSCPVPCGDHEVHTDCGSSCEATCATELGIELPRLCTTQCIVNTCVCEKGYVRDAYGLCIPLEACPQVVKCGVNEVWSNCGTECPETCATCSGIEENCYTTLCVPNTCVCKPGYVRDEFGECILKANCPVVCGPNEVWTDCGSNCSDTCATALGLELASACTTECIPNTCKCRPGYYRDHMGVCVHLFECPGYQKCLVNEEWTNCGSKCPETCSVALGVVPPPKCTRQCVLNTCRCREGFARNEFGVCTRLDLCPEAVQCCENEVWTNCAVFDDDRYDYVNALVVPGKHFVGCKKNTCQCIPGFVRNHENVCVDPVIFVDQFLCGENEIGVLVLDGTSINSGNYTCHCREGYVRDMSGLCVPEYVPKPGLVYTITKKTVVTKPNPIVLRCEQDEILVNCGSNSYQTCGTILGLETESVCDGKCYLNTCECRPGYVRLTKQTRQCVPATVEECRRYLQHILNIVNPAVQVVPVVHPVVESECNDECS